MSNPSDTPTGQVNVTPEGGPLDEGVPATAPGAGQVYATPEAGPLDEGEGLVPPTLRDHLKEPILGLDDAPTSGNRPDPTMATTSPPTAAPAAAREEDGGFGEDASTFSSPPPVTRTAEDDRELKKWPPYSGKPVSDVQQALKYAAPVAAQAEKLAIGALDLSARGLSRLARFLAERREQRDADDRGSAGGSR